MIAMLYDGKATESLSKRPGCDLCAAQGRIRAAIVDGVAMGHWGYLCGEHFEKYGVGLGTGRGQVLLCGDDMDHDLIVQYLEPAHAG